MENRITSKEVDIKGFTYRINKMDARSSCWLFTFLGSRSTDNSTLITSLGKCTRAEFIEIQNMLLSKVFRLDRQEDKEFPIAVLLPSGEISDPHLSYDAEAVMNLTSEAIMFNLSPFLAGSGSNSQTKQV